MGDHHRFSHGLGCSFGSQTSDTGACAVHMKDRVDTGWNRPCAQVSRGLGRGWRSSPPPPPRLLPPCREGSHGDSSPGDVTSPGSHLTRVRLRCAALRKHLPSGAGATSALVWMPLEGATSAAAARARPAVPVALSPHRPLSTPHLRTGGWGGCPGVWGPLGARKLAGPGFPEERTRITQLAKGLAFRPEALGKRTSE